MVGMVELEEVESPCVSWRKTTAKQFVQVYFSRLAAIAQVLTLQSSAAQLSGKAHEVSGLNIVITVVY